MKFLVLQRPPHGEQMLGIYSGNDAPSAIAKASEDREIEGRLTAFPLDAAVDANVTLAAPGRPKASVQVIAP